MNEEIWAPVLGYEGFYEVSNMGRVRSLTRRVLRPPCGNSKNPSFTTYYGRMLKQVFHKYGYAKVELNRDSKPVTFMVHRLVAQAFVPGSGVLVRHLDGDPKNNCAWNLAWGSYVDNEADKARHGRVPRGEKHHNSKLNEAQVEQILGEIAAGGSDAAIASRFGVVRYCIYSIRHGRTWTSLRSSHAASLAK